MGGTIHPGVLVEKHVLQYYWEERKIYPYEKTKAWYYGPREAWMKLVKEKNEKKLDTKKRRRYKKIKSKS
jgi:hypothetical protein